MLDSDIAAALGVPPPMPALTADIVPMIRAGMTAAAAGLQGTQLAEVRDFDADGVPVRLYRPTTEARLPLLVFLHGGGWMLGDLDTHDAMHRHIAARAGCAVLAVGYRLAPEHPFPAGLEDAAAAFTWARREAEALDCDSARIALGGESAGANLTAAIALRLRDADKPQPLFQLLVHPVTDMGFTLPSIDDVAAPGLTRDYLEACRDLYLGGGDIGDPLVSPLRATDHRGLAPAIVLTASEDPLRDDGECYARALVAAGVETLAMRLPGLPHGFLFLPIGIPAVGRSFDLVARLVGRYFANP
ncbi:alpha/beta hydrolase [Novosphingobium sp. Gsoil 351]|uniref:alpha/beta hydrolase n=1 Tax=Novosphingobium sp. Gsoil 351 TaxID=2675225 RepID=UPI0012B46E3B|nr:alpha/beta hydrolase [Novosphingobium sp. Gsoil 351]QGN55002.1 alpha/beta hydrolase fold domain-containing protein [Novosphingobium sp. Gsoil 351]